jgi:hypothetical protein
MMSWADRLTQREAGVAWYHYFCHRVTLRKHIRRMFDMYMAFLPNSCRIAISPGE